MKDNANLASLKEDNLIVFPPINITLLSITFHMF